MEGHRGADAMLMLGKGFTTLSIRDAETLNMYRVLAIGSRDDVAIRWEVNTVCACP